MVEFGLKLADNRVSEWSYAYIDYEKLKAFLKKAKDVQKKKKDQLEKRNPELAAQVKKSFEAEMEQRTREELPCFSRSSSFGSVHPPVEEDMQSIASVRSFASEDMKSVDVELAPDVVVSDESAALLPRRDGSDGGGDQVVAVVTSDAGTQYGSQGSILRLESSELEAPTEQLKRDTSTSNLSGVISSVTDYFTRSTYTDKLKESYKECYLRKIRFDAFLRKEVQELTQRLDTLVESVSIPEPTNDSESSTRSDSMLIKRFSTAPKHHRRMSNLSSFIHVTQRRFTGAIKKIQHPSAIEYPSAIQHPSAIEYGSDDDEEGHEAGTIGRAESDSIKRAIMDLYRRAKLLTNFCIMNYTGFVKVIKKHDKNFPEEKGKFKDIFADVIFNDGADAEQLCMRIERIYSAWFCGNNIREARAALLPKKGDGLEMDWTQLQLGFRIGMCTILMLWVCWDCIWGIVNQGNSTIGGRFAFPVFRACGGLLLWHWFWGISVFIWSRFRVNYIFLFDFDPRNVETPVRIFKEAVDETLVFLVLMLLYYKAGVSAIPNIVPPGAYPFLLVIYAIKELVVPWRTRGPLWKAIVEVITSPMTSPTFFTIYVADVFTSMVKVFQDLLWTFCFVVSGDFSIPEVSAERTPRDWQHSVWYKNVAIPLVCLFPLWIRFNQCLRRYMDTGKRCPNLANASKYALSQTVTLFGAFHPLYLYADHDNNNGGHNFYQFFWMLLFISSSLYSFFWDVYMDWGLGRPQYAFLGPRLMYPNHLYYYAVMCADFFLRFMWVLTLVPPQSGANFALPNYMTAVSMSLELFRRMLWGQFRLEQEHRHNTEGYRRVDFVPLHFNTGHDHKYKEQKEQRGKNVLMEVAAVSLIVIGISVASVIAAQKSAHVDDYDL